RHIDASATPLGQGLADHALGVALAIHLRSVDEVDPTLEGVMERADRGPVVDTAPVAADLPAAEADLADRPAGRAKGPIAHLSTSAHGVTTQGGTLRCRAPRQLRSEDHP